MTEVRREDGELCGHVEVHGDRWRALTVFGARLGEHDTEAAAQEQVLQEGLAALADRWNLVDGRSGDEQVVRIQHASPGEVTLALDYESVPGVPTLTVTAEDLAAGRWRLERR